MPDMADVDDDCQTLGQYGLADKALPVYCFHRLPDPLVPGAFAAACIVYYTLPANVGDIVLLQIVVPVIRSNEVHLVVSERNSVHRMHRR